MSDEPFDSSSSCAVWNVTWKHLRNAAGGNAKERLSDCPRATDPVSFIAYSKGKAVPLQAWSGPGPRKLRFPDFVTSAQDGGKVVSLTHYPSLPPGNAPGTHFC